MAYLDREKEQLRAIARDFRKRANQLDASFVATCDPRALQGGARCYDAEEHRAFAIKLAELADEMDMLP